MDRFKSTIRSSLRGRKSNSLANSRVNNEFLTDANALHKRNFKRRASDVNGPVRKAKVTRSSSLIGPQSSDSAGASTNLTVKRGRPFSKRPTLALENSTVATSTSVTVATSNAVVDPNVLRKTHEEFVRAFAIPTHLYRYLSQRHRARPLYLDRNLNYLMPYPRTKSKAFASREVNLSAIVQRLAKQRIKLPQETDARYVRSSNTNYEWPSELELCFEGFYDSEKELDWVTVDASVNVQLRFGWAWRRKICPDDTILNITPNMIQVNCKSMTNNNSIMRSALSNRGPSQSSDTCRFSPSNLISLARWNTAGGGRLKSAQLELHVAAVEKRWLKRPDPVSVQRLSHNTTSAGGNLRGGSHQNSTRKGSLSSASYPVHYATAPLPLIVSSSDGDNYVSNEQPLLLTAGVYELRLGVDNSANSNVLTKQNNNELSNGLADTYSPPTNSVPNHEIGGEPSQINQSGNCSGRIEWRRIRFPKSSKALDEYSRWPRLRFRVIWHPKLAQPEHPVTLGLKSVCNGDSSVPENGVDERSLYTRSMSNTQSRSRNSTTNNPAFGNALPDVKTEPQSSILDSVNLDRSLHQRLQQSLKASCGTTASISSSTDPLPFSCNPVTYCFIYGGNLQQWSESADLFCPWCRLDCSRAKEKGPEALLIHLRSCHPRFRFKAIWSASRSHLSFEVSLNEAYDGSNDCGLRRWGLRQTRIGDYKAIDYFAENGQLLGGWFGISTNQSTDNGSSDNYQYGQSTSLIKALVRVRRPLRRLPFTHLIYWRGVEQTNSQLLDSTLSVRPMVVGHNRVYYHTHTVQPVRACEFDVDSEAEDAPMWLRQHYQRKVEEFTDVNEGEKQIMQLWNSLLLSISPSTLVVCDSQLLTLLCQFVRRFASWIHKSHLRTNLLLHLVNLVDYGLLSTTHLRQLMMFYDKHKLIE